MQQKFKTSQKNSNYILNSETYQLKWQFLVQNRQNHDFFHNSIVFSVVVWLHCQKTARKCKKVPKKCKKRTKQWFAVSKRTFKNMFSWFTPKERILRKVPENDHFLRFTPKERYLKKSDFSLFWKPKKSQNFEKTFSR